MPDATKPAPSQIPMATFWPSYGFTKALLTTVCNTVFFYYLNHCSIAILEQYQTIINDLCDEKKEKAQGYENLMHSSNLFPHGHGYNLRRCTSPSISMEHKNVTHRWTWKHWILRGHHQNHCRRLRRQGKLAIDDKRCQKQPTFHNER